MSARDQEWLAQAPALSPSPAPSRPSFPACRFAIAARTGGWTASGVFSVAVFFLQCFGCCCVKNSCHFCLGVACRTAPSRNAAQEYSYATALATRQWSTPTRFLELDASPDLDSRRVSREHITYLRPHEKCRTCTYSPCICSPRCQAGHLAAVWAPEIDVTQSDRCHTAFGNRAPAPGGAQLAAGPYSIGPQPRPRIFLPHSCAPMRCRCWTGGCPWTPGNIKSTPTRSSARQRTRSSRRPCGTRARRGKLEFLCMRVCCVLRQGGREDKRKT